MRVYVREGGKGKEKGLGQAKASTGIVTGKRKLMKRKIQLRDVE